jgi:hypothetical protein
VSELPADIFHGDLELNGAVLSNTIPVPFHHQGVIKLRLVTDAPAQFVISGTDAELTLIGEPAYVETFPGTNSRC